jgi:hypothetical protein
MENQRIPEPKTIAEKLNLTINPFDVTFEPLAGSTLTNLIRLLSQNRFKISLIGFPRAFYSILLCLIISPLNIVERVRFHKKINQTTVVHPPIFIVGHWRSGTTYLHNALSKDPQFAYPTTLQTVAPAIFMGFENLIKPIVVGSLPETRPQDNIKLGADLPQEEEYAIGNLSPYSFYHGWCFPKNMDFYNKFVFMDEIPNFMIDEWKNVYMHFIKKITLYFNNKQLLLKNPPNTGRIKLLLELFPDAKFIHIYRNPYHVYMSMKRNIEKEMTLYTLQHPDDKEKIIENMIKTYRKMFVKYFKEKTMIPNGNLVEVQYEDFVSNPLDTVKFIYEQLNLTGFKDAKPYIKKYVDTQKNVKAFSYEIDGDSKKMIYKNLNFTINFWGYKNE